MRWAGLSLVLFLLSSNASARTPIEMAESVSRSARTACADFAVLRAMLELETDPKAVEIYKRTIRERTEEALLEIEAAIAVVVTADEYDDVTVGLLRKALVFSRCVDGARVDRDLAFLQRVREHRLSGL